MQSILDLYCVPPIAIARLGGSTTPLAAYAWSVPPNPRSEGDTVVTPDWSLNVLTDGSVEPFRPDSIRFRDGDLIRPVCPFVEVWARLGEAGSDPSTWQNVPVTDALLRQFGTDMSALTFTIDARNAKVARRTGNRDLAYGTFPPVSIPGDQRVAVELLASSPPGVSTPMIPRDRSIPLGSVQIIRSKPNPSAGSVPWPASIDLEVVRLRYTPATGSFYGPPAAAVPTDESTVPAVVASNAFLDPAAGWFGSDGRGGGFVIPADTFDMQGTGSSLGVIDDTCELRVDVQLEVPATGLMLKLPGTSAIVLRTHASIFVAPPDFGPDRRPFLTIADELNDRSGDAAQRNAALSRSDLDEWVQDLFERVYETVSLFNVDFWRRALGWNPLPAPRLAASPVPDDGVNPVDQAMGSRDALRNRSLAVAGQTSNNPLPLSEHARDRHRSISDLDRLSDLVASAPGRLKELIRGPFEVESGESRNSSTMRMPPFMSHSNAGPVTLAAWQYSLVMRWVDEVSKQPAPPAAGPLIAAVAAPAPLSAAAAARQDDVLRRLA